MPFNIEQIIQQVGELPPLPQAAQKALALIRDPKSSMSEVSNALVVDQVMTSLVLRWANSAYYGLRNPVTTVQQAVTYLGQNTIQSLILAASVASFFDRPVPGYALDRGDLWKHAIGVAAGARIIAARKSAKLAEEAYHAGLLCDIGKLAFEVLLRIAQIPMNEWRGRSFTDLEMYYFGVDHAALGAEMVRRWNLPASLQAAVAHHHHPSQAGENSLLASAVHLAVAAVMTLGIGVGRDGLQYNLEPAALELWNWNEADQIGLFDRIRVMVRDAESFIGLTRRQ
jgi:HD-like signal output (HDOD) protein